MSLTMTKLPEEPIAIIGLACRFPGGCSSPSKLWELLVNPRDVRTPFDPKRLNLERFYHANGSTHGSTDVKAKQAYLLSEDTRLFDAGVFGISPVEAAGMDPQQRLLLEVAYEACCEAAGVPLDLLRGSRTSVQVGSMSNDFAAIQGRDTEMLPKYNATGTANSILANRVSYVFDLKGPSVTVDTACSSSLVALHYAVQGLRSGDSDAAIVGGTNLIMDPGPYIAESKLQMLSPDSECRMWDARANGYARGEGVAALLLKPLARARADGNPVLGVVRATGVNSDGQSPGITMPYAPTQTELILQTYRRAGLDPLHRVADRPQYFECHGTGTQAGDPVEAKAVYDALFPLVDGQDHDNRKTLIVGSIKTIIGHTEGCAGLAGVIKCLLMFKHRTVPPNMHFNELNPKVSSYYGPGRLEIPTKKLVWPARPLGAPMRASVNSFGFGGTNAHAILEALPDDEPVEESTPRSSASSNSAFGPLLFSANSGAALLRNVQTHLEYIEKHINSESSVDVVQHLSSILQTHRTTHRVRTFFPGATRQDIVASMSQFITSHTGKKDIGTVPRLVNASEAPGILGVFTGQGAQWATMGRELMGASPLFRRSLEECDKILQYGLPHSAPAWSVVDELTKEAKESRLGEAALAQPLCTAIQIAQVDMLTALGIRLDAVVGHSSGEIAAVYAAGLITRPAAMQIAFYRGLFASQLPSSERRGGMLAVGLSLQAASELCDQPAFTGRLVVAASNAPQNCTLSGDLDAVLEAKQKLDQEGVFARQLHVDTAYHLQHMAACAGAYSEALAECNIVVTLPARDKPMWSSSVFGDARLAGAVGNASSDLIAALKGPYWVRNLLQMVKFSQAIESAIWHGGPFDVAIELGPHPALKGPLEQTLKAIYGGTGASAVPLPRNTSLLRRKVNDIAVVQEAIGTIWAQLGPAYIDFAGYRSIWGDDQEITASKILADMYDLPGYSWDHDKVYWRESRISARYRTLSDSPHELLGRRVPDDDDHHELRWRNILRLREIPWLRGHEVLGEVLLPGAAYVSIAAQAAQSLAVSLGKGRPIAQLAVEDLDILRPVVVPDNEDGVATVFTIQVLPPDKAQVDVIRAQFAYYVCPNESTGAMMHTSSGKLVIHLSPKNSSPSNKSLVSMLPPREPVPTTAVHVEGEAIYDMFSHIGLAYQDDFAAISGCDRAQGYATATAVWPSSSAVSASIFSSSSSYVLHPVILDIGFQSLFLAHAHPASLLLKTALLPSHIDRVLINPHVSVFDTISATTAATTSLMDAWVTEATGSTLNGDISLFAANEAAEGTEGQTVAFAQIEGLHTRAAGGTDASQDRQVFSRTMYGPDVSVMGLTLPLRDAKQDAQTMIVNEATERLTLWYIRHTLGEVPPLGSEEWNGLKLQPHHERMLESFTHHINMVRQGRHPLVRTEWLMDGPDEIAELEREHADTVEFQLVHAVGAVLGQAVMSREANSSLLLQSMQQNDLLNRFYMENNTSVATNKAIGQLLKQITFKFPRCNILEIGAGTGGTTWNVLNAVDNLYTSYTFTDVSPAFFPAAADKLAGFERIAYRTLDIEQEPQAQGFVPHTYDVVIAANVLHATKHLEETLARVRSLLRSGGYLVMLETTGTQSMVGYLFGGLPGWWQGTEPARRLGPTVPILEWNRVLSRVGFSGADTVLYDSPEESRHVTSCIVSQAVDPDVLRLRSPLSYLATEESLPPTPILIVGGRRLATAHIIDKITQMLPATWWSRIYTALSIDELEVDEEGRITALDADGRLDVVCLQDVDELLFKDLPMSAVRLQRLQQLFMSAGRLLWVTSGGVSSPTRASMIRGITRVVPKEIPELRVQVMAVDLDLLRTLTGSADNATARLCVESLLRLRHIGELEKQKEREGMSLPLWAIEPEFEVLAGGKEVRIPRVVPANALNERFAARTRPIVKTVDARDAIIRADVNVAGRMELRRVVDIEEQYDGTQVQVQVQHTLHIPSSRGQKPAVYLVRGLDTTSSKSPDHDDKWVLALSSSNTSRLALPPDTVVYVDPSCCSSPASIRATADVLLRRALVRRVAAYAEAGTAAKIILVLFEPKQAIAEKLKAELDEAAPGCCVEVCCILTSSTDTDFTPLPAGWVRIHANLSRRMIKQYLPHQVDLFVDCSSELEEDTTHTGEHEHAREQLKACLPSSCQIWTFDGELLPEQPLPELLGGFSSQLDPSRDERSNIKVLQAADLAGADARSLSRQQYLVNWQSQQVLPLTIQPPEADVLDPQKLLRADCTYLIMGGSGGLGLSITRWMIRHGAKHVVIASRRPRQLDNSLQAEALHAGVELSILAVDATQQHEVMEAVTRIRKSMPPIAGVCNFGMVLHDAVFLDMDAVQLNETLASKVLGTEILDSVFGPGAEPLDFFIVTSSAASTIGNVAQANYHAANLFMDAAVARRRARGLAASIMHIGWVADTGYITRFSKEKQLADHFRSIRLTPLSETDVQDAFALAVRASKVSTTDTNSKHQLDAATSILEHDITMGLAPPTAPMQPSQASKAVWTSDPRLLALQPYNSTELEGASMQQQQQQQQTRLEGRLRDQVSQAGAHDAAVAVVAAAFGAKLETILQLPAGAVHENNGLERAVIDLGIDSLVAVEIRTWLLKELDTDVPIVKILGGETVLQICVQAAKKILADHKANAGDDNENENSISISPTPPEAKDQVDAALAVAKAKGPASEVVADIPPASLAAESKIPIQTDVDSELNDNLIGGSSSSNRSDSSSRSNSFIDNPRSENTAFNPVTNEFEDKDEDAIAPELTLVLEQPVVVREAPMSATQSRFWFTYKHSDDPASCNTAFYYHLRGPRVVNPARLRRALQLIAAQHECLRTCYYPRLEDGHPMQGVMAKSALQLTHTKHATRAAADRALQQTLVHYKTRAWNLERGHTMAISLIGLENEQEESEFIGYLVLGYHHITLDGWSVALLWRDIDRAYRMQPLSSVDPGSSYVDYSLQQVEKQSTSVLDDDLAFWRAEFAGSLPDTLPLLPMACGLDRAALTRQQPQSEQEFDNTTHHHLDYELDPAQIAAVKVLSKRLQISAFHVHLSLMQVLLARLAGVDDICIGIVDANRRDPRFATTLGCFVNILPLRATDVALDADFATVARAASRKAMAVFARGTVPLGTILEVAQAPRVSDVHPLFQTSINYRTAGGGGIDIWDLPLGQDTRMNLEWRGSKEAEIPYDISLGFFETPTGCLAQIWCSARLYDPTACQMFLDMYFRVLQQVATDPFLSIRDLRLHDDEQIHRALDAGSGPQVNFDDWHGRSLYGRMRNVCRLCPSNTAVTDADGSISYSQLAARTSRMARRLRKQGIVNAEHRVAVLCEPSIDGIVAMLAIMEAGGVYVPLDISLPTSRHADILRQCKAELVLVHAQSEHRLRQLLDEGITVGAVRVGSDGNDDDDEDITNVERVNDDNGPVILLFTSGSTGKPKGIILSQANWANQVAIKTTCFNLQPTDCILQQSSLGFDMAFMQSLMALANGSRLVIAPIDIRRDPVAMAALMVREGISVTLGTPTEYLAWINASANSDVQFQGANLKWRLAMSGGEHVPTQLKTELRRLGIPGFRLVNCYGPTETTAQAAFQRLPLDDGEQQVQDSGVPSPDAPRSAFWRQYAVGKAIPNYAISIVDAAGRPQPLGYTGEICIGGAGVALGYLDRPELTRAKFVTNVIPDTRAYLTGDKGRLLPDGTLLCLGRLDGDTQIKLRGQRVELTEVESAVLEASKGTLASVVVSRRGDVLVAHATLTKHEGFPSSHRDEAALSDILLRVRLPQTFIPAALYILDAIPMTANGKLDRKAIASLALPDKNVKIGGMAEAGGRDPVPDEKLTVRQGELRLLWERVLMPLGDRRIGPSSDFFLCGGNSILLMKLQQAIKETTGISISTKRLYEATTLRAMAHAIFDDPETKLSSQQDQQVLAIDWDAETSVPGWLQQEINQLGKTNTSSPIKSETKEGFEVLLTGASSFLGSHLLTALLQHPSVSKVHCVAVPVDHHQPDSPKAVYYIGSLLSPTLGLTPAERETLSRTIHLIVHAGAHGHCLNRFATLRRPNLESLHALAALAIPRAVPLLFLSSPRVLLLAGDTDTPRAPGSLRKFPPGSDGTDGYTASKWAGEVFLEKLVGYVSAHGGGRGLRVAVHRPCTLVSEQAPNSDAMNGILRYSLAMRCVPRLRRAEGYLDFAPLDVVIGRITDAAVELGLQPASAGADGGEVASLVFRHHSSGIKTPFGQFCEHMKKVYGGDFGEVDMEEWLVLAGKRGLDPLITAYTEALLESEVPLKSPYLGQE